jgi:predicted N-acetyltransferase YhbS
MQEPDCGEADALLRSAFVTERPFMPELRKYLAFQPDGWHLAYLDDVLVGIVGAADYQAFGYIGLLAVAPTTQRRGIGRQLMDTILAWLEARGTPAALLDASDEGVQLYERLGFVTSGRTGTFVRHPRAKATCIPDGVERLTEADVERVSLLDQEAFGGVRGELLRDLQEEYANRSFLMRDTEGAPVGYVIAREQRLGPWVASDLYVAEALLQAALSLPFTHPLSVIMPLENAWGVELLPRYDFMCMSDVQHMQRGKPTTQPRRELIFGQLSVAIG